MMCTQLTMHTGYRYSLWCLHNTNSLLVDNNWRRLSENFTSRNKYVVSYQKYSLLNLVSISNSNLCNSSHQPAYQYSIYLYQRSILIHQPSDASLLSQPVTLTMHQTTRWCFVWHCTWPMARAYSIICIQIIRILLNNIPIYLYNNAPLNIAIYFHTRDETTVL